MPDESEIQRRAADHTDARCSSCREHPRKVGPLVEGEGSDSTGGDFICADCAELALTNVAEEMRHRGRGTREDKAETPKLTDFF